MDMKEIYICLYIFLGTVIELIAYTLRIAITTRGNKFVVSILGMINNALGITITALIATTIATKPYRTIIYAAAYTLGSYIGVKLDEMFAFGKDFITIIVNKEKASLISNNLRKVGFAFTTLEGKGKEQERTIMKIATMRKRKREVLEIIDTYAPNAMLIDEVIYTKNALR